ncbi:MAG: hypothetical protein LJF30_13745 [Acidobacteria bacterium]|nr:hypothetical protein [Acidobacteriota bacterium]
MATGQTRRWTGVVLMVCFFTLGMGGCGGDPNPLSGLLGVAMTFDPAEATATASEVEGSQWSVAYQVTLQETRGEIGGVVTRFNVIVYEASGGAPGVEAESAQSAVNIPSTRLDPGGRVQAVLETHYSLVNGGRAAFIDVTAFIDDDAGLTGDVTSRLTVR